MVKPRAYYKKQNVVGHGVPQHLFTYDKEGLESATHAREARQICDAICRLPGLTQNITVTDACAGAGGNAMAFVCCDLFLHVHIVEINADRFKQHLTPNLEMAISLWPHTRTSYILYLSNYVHICRYLKQDVIFLDPPWSDTELSLDGVPVYELIHSLLTHARYILLKAPNRFLISDKIACDVLCDFKKYKIYIMSNSNKI